MSLRGTMGCLVAIGIAVTARSAIGGQGPYLIVLDSMSRAYAVSDDGTVVVGYGDLSFGPGSWRTVALRWDNGEVRPLGDLPGGEFRTQGAGLSADGRVAVGLGVSAEGEEAFRWEGGVMVGLGDLPEGDFSSWAGDASADGTVVVGSGSPRQSDGDPYATEAFRWTQEIGMVGLGDLPGGGFDSAASGVSADGLVVVGGGESVLGREAFRWTEATGMVGLGDLPGGEFYSLATDVSADGTVVVGWARSAKSGWQAFRWTQDTGMEGLGFLPGGGLRSSVAWAVSGNGCVVVGDSWSEEGGGSFIWDETHGMRNLSEVLMEKFFVDLTGWELYSAKAVSFDGSYVVGRGIGPENQTAWRAYVPLDGPDCNQNDINDLAEIDAGTSQDCDGNWEPDECQPDFDGDGIIDPCDPDIDDDAVLNDGDLCDDTPPGTPVTPLGATIGDYDGDCWVTRYDFRTLRPCLGMSGPGTPVGSQPCVDSFDVDADEDIDLSDFAWFQRAINSGNGGRMACAPENESCFVPHRVPGCDEPSCCEAVSALDTFCHDIAWDNLCVAAALSLCPDIGDGPACGPENGDCSEPNGSPGCDDPYCCQTICEQDSFCCLVVWDAMCSGAAAFWCN